ncbi:hypothetical protein [Thermoactinospora rubra]|uniref:hypothetical protein n=1 Tax=Thermoactinospora rubra TaxID=1088767 RepID=UPI00117EFD35|nr:hypothetical protein [Thermoactinospora rubra]
MRLHRTGRGPGREVIGGTLRVLRIVQARPDGQRLLVHWAPAGSDGWRAHYDFTVAGGRIVPGRPAVRRLTWRLTCRSAGAVRQSVHQAPAGVAGGP